MQATQLPCFQMLIDRLGSGETDKVEVLMLHQLFQSLMLARLEARRNNAADPIRTVPDHIYTLIRRCTTNPLFFHPLLVHWFRSRCREMVLQCTSSQCELQSPVLLIVMRYHHTAEWVPACRHACFDRKMVATVECNGGWNVVFRGIPCHGWQE